MCRRRVEVGKRYLHSKYSTRREVTIFCFLNLSSSSVHNIHSHRAYQVLASNHSSTASTTIFYSSVTMALRGIPKAFLPALFCFLSFGSSSTSTTRTDLALAFVPVSLSAGPSGSRAVTATQTNTHHRPSAVSLGVVSVPETAEALQEMTNARFAFWMCFYGAAGVGSIGRELIPIVFGRYQSTSSLESESTSGTAEKLLL